MLLLLTRRLGRYGLRVNQKKVDIWAAAKLEANRCRDLHAIFAQKGDNKNPVLVRKFAKNYLEIPQRKLAKSWNRGLPLLNRLLYSNLESLPTETFEKLFDRFASRDYLLRADHRKLARVVDLARRIGRLGKINKNLKLLLESSVHNAFHYEVRAFARESNDSELETICNSRIRDLEGLMKTAEE